MFNFFKKKKLSQKNVDQNVEEKNDDQKLEGKSARLMLEKSLCNLKHPTLEEILEKIEETALSGKREVDFMGSYIDKETKLKLEALGYKVLTYPKPSTDLAPFFTISW